MSVTGTANGTPFVLSGTVVGATFNVTGTIAGQSVQYVGLYETSANDFRVYDAASAAITITAGPAIAVSVSPMTASLATGGVTQAFTATVQNDAQNKGVTWSVAGANCSGAACGAVSPTSSSSGAAVTYTSPPNTSPTGTVTLTATSVSNNALAWEAHLRLSSIQTA